jgi:hypothetical protein
MRYAERNIDSKTADLVQDNRSGLFRALEQVTSGLYINMEENEMQESQYRLVNHITAIIVIIIIIIIIIIMGEK